VKWADTPRAAASTRSDFIAHTVLGWEISVRDRSKHGICTPQRLCKITQGLKFGE